jgi:hypothetical protein
VLPDSLKDFAYCNAAPVDPGRDFHSHVDRLIRALDQVLQQKLAPNEALAVVPHPPRPGHGHRVGPTRRAAVGGLVAAIACVVLALGATYAWRPSWLSAVPGLRQSTPVATSGPVATLPPPPSAPPATDECADMKAVLQTVASLETIRGPRQNDGSWATPRKVAGYATCYLRELLSLTYVCETGIMEPAEAKTIHDAKVAAVSACMSADWTKPLSDSVSSSFRNPATGQLITVMTLNSPGDRRIVALMMRQGPAAPQDRPPVAVGPQAQPVDLPKNFCPEIKRVIAEAQSNFDRILSRKSGSHWSTRVSLPDFDECSINDGGNYRYLSCQISPYVNPDDASKGVDAMGGYLAGCLGSDWIRRRRIGADQTVRISFEAGPKDASIDIRTRQSALNNRWLLIVDVNTFER